MASDSITDKVISQSEDQSQNLDAALFGGGGGGEVVEGVTSGNDILSQLFDAPLDDLVDNYTGAGVDETTASLQAAPQYDALSALGVRDSEP